jgi:hypothetical protein
MEGICEQNENKKNSETNVTLSAKRTNIRQPIK